MRVVGTLSHEEPWPTRLFKNLVSNMVIPCTMIEASRLCIQLLDQ